MSDSELSPMQLPLIEIQGYDPCFKVDTRLHEPLWKYQFSSDEVALEVLALCAQLEPLCKKEYSRTSGGIDEDHKIEYLNKFEPLANVLTERMQEYLNLLPSPKPSLREYFKQSGLTVMFPRISSYLMNPNSPMFKNHKSSMDGYFQHLAMLNQLTSMSHQLNSDVNNLNNHKYMAHQTALLYQAVNQAGPGMAHYKKEIEENFKHIKESLSQTEKGEEPKLERVQKEWVNTVTGEVLNDATSMQSQLFQPLKPVIQFFQQQEKQKQQHQLQQQRSYYR